MYPTKFGGCMPSGHVITSREIKEWYRLILVCILAKFGGCLPGDHVITSREM